MLSDRPERLNLLLRVCDAGNWPKAVFGQSRRVWVLRQAQDALLDVRREPKEHEHLSHTRPADALAPGDVRLPLHRARVELLPPFEGLAEGLDHGRRPGLAGRLRRPRRIPWWRDGRDHTVGGHLARQHADIAVLERPVRSQRDLDGLFAEFDRTLDVVGRYVDNAEPDLRDGPSGLTEGSSGSFLPRISALPALNIISQAVGLCHLFAVRMVGGGQAVVAATARSDEGLRQ